MDEIGKFELDESSAPVGCFIACRQTLTVSSGIVWLTLVGEREDLWLGEGDSIDLLPFSVIWLGPWEASCGFQLFPTSSVGAVLMAPVFRGIWSIAPRLAFLMARTRDRHTFVKQLH